MDEYDTLQIIRKLKKHFDALSKDSEELNRILRIREELSKMDDSTVLDENGESLIFEKEVVQKKKRPKPTTPITMAVDLENIDISREMKWIQKRNIYTDQDVEKLLSLLKGETHEKLQ